MATTENRESHEVNDRARLAELASFGALVSPARDLRLFRTAGPPEPRVSFKASAPRNGWCKCTISPDCIRCKLKKYTFCFFFCAPSRRSSRAIRTWPGALVQDFHCCTLGVGHCRVHAAANDLFRQTDRFDQADKADLETSISRANSCLRTRNFDCAERELQSAARLAFTSGDKQQVAAVKQAMAAEKKVVANEEAALVASARSREQSDRNAALLELCQRSCPIQWQAYMCVGGSKAPESCDASEGDYEARKSTNSGAGDAVCAAAGSVLNDYSFLESITT